MEKPDEHRASSRSLSVVLTTAYPRTNMELSVVRDLHARDRIGLHRVTSNPDKADLILFVNDFHTLDDPMHLGARRHPWVKRYREKVFTIVEDDHPWCYLPGLYASMPKRFFRADRQRASIYIALPNSGMDAKESITATPDLLYSFVGKRSHKIRTRILNLDHPRGYVDDTTAIFNANAPVGDTAERRAIRQRFATISAQSKFILCPRGGGTSSYRLFETLDAGRVPVILSDQWVAPIGPDWDSFSLRIPEAQAEHVPQILERNEDRWPEMARRAREAWLEWFAPDVRFHRMIESCAQILESRKMPEAIAQRVPSIPYLEWQTYMLVRPLVHRVRYPELRNAGRSAGKDPRHV